MNITKGIVIGLLFIISFKGNAQDLNTILTDDLVKDKGKVLAKYLPMSKGVYLYNVYLMPKDDVQKKLEAFRADIMMKVEKYQTTELKVLAKKDIDYYIRKAMSNYLDLYGIDSLGMVNLTNVLMEKKGEANFLALIMEANKKAFVKIMAPVSKTKLLDSLYENKELDNTALFKRSAAYRTWMDSYVTRLRNTKYRKDTTLGYSGMPVVKLKIINDEIPAGFIKDHLIYETTAEILKTVKDIPAKEEAYNNFMALSSPANYRKDIEIIYANDKMMSGNAISPDFSYPDINGKRVDLKSLRGKYVYIDIWATWCVPCKAETPFLQKLEHEFRDKNIHFVSLSVDRISDKDKWIKYVKTNSLTGIQIMADRDFQSQFIQKFNISAIPRFILIDPAGKIISGDAKRPSDPALKRQLEDLL